jgi:anti-sigma B factor antagonist
MVVLLILLIGSVQMEITVKTVNDVEIVFLNGRLDAYNSNLVENKFDEIIDSGKVQVVADLSGVDYISSSGLRVTLSSLKKLNKMGGTLKLSSLQPYVLEVFEIAGFTQLFQIYHDENEAVASF